MTFEFNSIKNIHDNKKSAEYLFIVINLHDNKKSAEYLFIVINFVLQFFGGQLNRF